MSVFIYLEVPYSEKDQCRAAGGKWDGEKKLWYVPIGINPAPFERWMTPNGRDSWRRIYGGKVWERALVRSAARRIREGRL